MNRRLYILLLSSLFALFSCSSAATIKRQLALYNQGEHAKSLAMTNELLASDNPAVQIKALRFISKVHYKQAGDKVLALFDSPNLEVQTQAIITVGDIQYTPAKDKLLTYIFTKKRSNAIRTAPQLPSYRDKGMQPLVAKWETTSDPVKKQAIRTLLQKIGIAAAEPIILSLAKGSVATNKEKIKLLAQFHSPVVTGILLDHLNDENMVPSVLLAIQSMGNNAVNPLIAALQKLQLNTTDKQQLEKQSRIILLLGKIKATKAIPLLDRYATSSDLILQARAKQALKRIRRY